MMTESPVYVSLDFTPNPNTLKYTVNRQLLESGTWYIRSVEQAKNESPLAERILTFGGLEAVMIGRDFITITKKEESDWDQVHKHASRAIQEHLNQGGEVMKAGFVPYQANVSSPGGSIEAQVREFLEREIKPAVAMDGGNIDLDRIEDGIVYVNLQGSCSGCPSSTATLKQGIEARLQQLIPGIKEVVAV
jgi:Fe-S cluster biogenesis protein NfuA